MTAQSLIRAKQAIKEIQLAATLEETPHLFIFCLFFLPLPLSSLFP